MDLAEIKECIPHRDPFLWLDTVTELTETRIRASKTLQPELPVFQGHYPNFPIFPGVLQCEACFQAGAILISKLVTAANGDVPVVTRVNNVQFRRMIRPGETVDIEVELTERMANAFYLKGKASVGGKVSARMEFVCATAAAE